MSKKVQPVVETKAPVAPQHQNPVSPVVPEAKLHAPKPEPHAPNPEHEPHAAKSKPEPHDPKPGPEPHASKQQPEPHAPKPEPPETTNPIGPPVFDLFHVSPDLDPALTARQYYAINKKASHRESINNTVHRINKSIDLHYYARR